MKFATFQSLSFKSPRETALLDNLLPNIPSPPHKTCCILWISSSSLSFVETMLDASEWLESFFWGLKSCLHEKTMKTFCWLFSKALKTSTNSTGSRDFESSGGSQSVGCFLMVPQRGFLFLRFGGDCALKCENWCVFYVENSALKSNICCHYTMLNDTKWR